MIDVAGTEPTEITRAAFAAPKPTPVSVTVAPSTTLVGLKLVIDDGMKVKTGVAMSGPAP